MRSEDAFGHQKTASVFAAKAMGMTHYQAQRSNFDLTTVKTKYGNEPYKFIAGYELVLSRFGQWPSFHDGEVQPWAALNDEAHEGFAQGAFEKSAVEGVAMVDGFYPEDAKAGSDRPATARI